MELAIALCWACLVRARDKRNWFVEGVTQSGKTSLTSVRSSVPTLTNRILVQTPSFSLGPAPGRLKSNQVLTDQHNGGGTCVFWGINRIPSTVQPLDETFSNAPKGQWIVAEEIALPDVADPGNVEVTPMGSCQFFSAKGPSSLFLRWGS